MNIPSECRIASIVPNHAMILSYDANPKPDRIFGKDRLVILTSRPYRHGHGDDSLCRCIDLGFPFSHPSRAQTQACRSSASVDRSAPTTPRSTSAFIPGSTSMGVALPDLAPGHRRDGTGQARNRGRVASQGLPVLLALAITSSGTTQDQSRNP